MRKDLIIIHAKKLNDDDYQDTTISLDRESFQIFSDIVGGDQIARNMIREWIAYNEGCPPPGKSVSRQVQSLMLGYLADLLLMRKQATDFTMETRKRKINPRPIADLARVLEITDPENPGKIETLWSNKTRLRKLFIEGALRIEELEAFAKGVNSTPSPWIVKYAVTSIFDELCRRQWHTPATLTTAFLLDPSNAKVAVRGAADSKIKKKVQIAIKLQGSDPAYGKLVPAFKDEIIKLPNVS